MFVDDEEFFLLLEENECKEEKENEKYVYIIRKDKEQHTTCTIQMA